jgi:hypothetical protein
MQQRGETAAARQGSGGTTRRGEARQRRCPVSLVTTGPACHCPFWTHSNHLLWSASVTHFVWEKIEEKFVVETTREHNRKIDQIWWNVVLFRAKKMLKFGTPLMVAVVDWERESLYIGQQHLLVTLQRFLTKNRCNWCAAKEVFWRSAPFTPNFAISLLALPRLIFQLFLHLNSDFLFFSFVVL